ncbi:MAG: D-glycerate dehydrogenase [Desulfobacterales bacterium]|nr:D-glycerate dehydrogenase [Desulfobacterales bacterium]
MARPSVFITQPLEKSALERLRQVMDVMINPNSSRTIVKEELISGVDKKDYLFCRLGDIVDADVIQAGQKLKLIATMALTPGQIDVQAATRRKIAIAVPVQGALVDGIAEATADINWALMMAVARRVVEGDKLVRAGIFPGPQSMHLLGAPVNGKTLGIIGMGKIGKAVARRGAGFGMKILYYSRKRHQDAEDQFGALYVTLENLLENADFVSVHTEYSPETHHLMGANEFSLMKSSAFLINTSRGPIVDQAALMDALKSNKIAGAAIDVFEDEPHPHLSKAFVEMKNVVFTPHLGSAVPELREAMANAVVDSILEFRAGKRPATICNPEVFDT